MNTSTRFVWTLFAFMLFFFVSPSVMAAPDLGAVADDAAEAADAGAEEAATPDVPESKEDASTGSADTDTGSAAEDDPLDHAQEAFDAGKEGEYALMLSAIIMFVLGVARKFKLMEKVPSAALPWVSAGAGVLLAVAAELGTGGALTFHRVLAGAMAGMAASGAWSMIGKHLLKVSGSSDSAA